jgi:hypothetical protein
VHWGHNFQWLSFCPWRWGDNGRNGTVLPWTSMVNDHFILSSDAKSEEVVEFGPLWRSGQEGLHLWFSLSTLILHEEGEGLVSAHKPQGWIQNRTLKMTQQGWQWFLGLFLFFNLFPCNLRAVFSGLLESFFIQGPRWWIEKWNSEHQGMQCVCGAESQQAR